jgi:hypothetical protein
MRELGWCGEMMLEAFAVLFECCVRIFSPEATVLQLNEADAAKMVVYLAYNGFSHYDAVIEVGEVVFSNEGGQHELHDYNVGCGGKTTAVISLCRDIIIDPWQVGELDVPSFNIQTHDDIINYWEQLQEALKRKQFELVPGNNSLIDPFPSGLEIDLTKVTMVTLYDAGKARAHLYGRAGLGDTNHQATGERDHSQTAETGICILGHGSLILDFYKWLCPTMGWKYTKKLARFHAAMTIAQLKSLPSLKVIRCCSKLVFRQVLAALGFCGTTRLGNVVEVDGFLVWGTYHPMYAPRKMTDVELLHEQKKHSRQFHEKFPDLCGCSNHPCSLWAKYDSVNCVTKEERNRMKGPFYGLKKNLRKTVTKHKHLQDIPDEPPKAEVDLSPGEAMTAIVDPVTDIIEEINALTLEEEHTLKRVSNSPYILLGHFGSLQSLHHFHAMKVKVLTRQRNRPYRVHLLYSTQQEAQEDYNSFSGRFNITLLLPRFRMYFYFALLLIHKITLQSREI